ncbi:MAG: uncharacterized protein QG670_72 [Thermoproteota archaeon]|nr:uncharacterized protein [Thermoproteota archaeon]
MEKNIIYFEKKGVSNTNRTIEAARKRAEELGIKDVVVASSHGGTALKVAEAFQKMKENIVAITISSSFGEEGWVMTEEERKKLIVKGIRVLTCLHSLGDNVSSAFIEKNGGTSIEEVVRETLYRFSQGMKVCVEIVMMAADAGLIDVDKEVIAIAGTGEGADTAVVVKPSYPRKFQSLEIREIIAKPRIP